MMVKAGVSNTVVSGTAKVLNSRAGMNFQIQETSPTVTGRFQPTKIAQVQIPTVQNPKNRKSIETTAMLLAQNRELLTVATQQTPQKNAEKTSPPMSPPDLVTPPSSERSTSGDGKGNFEISVSQAIFSNNTCNPVHIFMIFYVYDIEYLFFQQFLI